MGASASRETVPQGRAPSGKFFTAQIRHGAFENLFLTANIQSNPRKHKSEEIPVTLDKPCQGSRNQTWYIDPINSAIRPVLKENEELCLDVAEDGGLVLRKFVGARSQQWSIQKDIIQQLDSPERVVSAPSINMTETDDLDIKSTKCDVEPPINTKPEQQLRCYDKGSTTAHLCWHFAHRKAVSFFIMSSTADGVLDIRGGSSKPETEVIIYPKWPDLRKNQIWYEDTEGCIRSRVDDGTMILSSKEGKMYIYDENGEKMPRYALECTTSKEKRIRRVEQGDNTVVVAVGENLGASMGTTWYMACCRPTDDADGRKAELWEIEYYQDCS